MPVILTDYVLTRNDTPLVTIVETTSFDSLQLYVDNKLLKEQTSTTFIEEIPVNKKIDLLGLVGGEVGIDYSWVLDPSFGDKVELTLNSLAGKLVRVYYDNATGYIDYGRPLATVDPTNLASIGDGFGLGQFGFAAFGSPLALTIWISHRLPSGTYKFALVNYNDFDNYHTPQIETITIATRPDELVPSISSYDPLTDTLILSTND